MKIPLSILLLFIALHKKGIALASSSSLSQPENAAIQSLPFIDTLRTSSPSFSKNGGNANANPGPEIIEIDLSGPALPLPPPDELFQALSLLSMGLSSGTRSPFSSSPSSSNTANGGGDDGVVVEVIDLNMDLPPPVALPGELDKMLDKQLASLLSLDFEFGFGNGGKGEEGKKAFLDFGFDGDKVMPHCNHHPLPTGPSTLPMLPPILSFLDTDRDGKPDSHSISLLPSTLEFHTSEMRPHETNEEWQVVTVAANLKDVQGKEVDANSAMEVDLTVLRDDGSVVHKSEPRPLPIEDFRARMSSSSSAPKADTLTTGEGEKKKECPLSRTLRHFSAWFASLPIEQKAAICVAEAVLVGAIILGIVRLVVMVVQRGRREARGFQRVPTEKEGKEGVEKSVKGVEGMWA